MQQFGKIIIGSSPVSLLEAIFSENKTGTCIIDDAPQPGGAWKTWDTTFPGANKVELGCHIFEKDRKVYDFFRNTLGFSLREMKPQPAIVYKSNRLPYHAKNFIFLFRDLRYYFTYKYGFRHFLLNISLFFKELAQLGLKYYNFESDSVTLTEKLVLLVQEKDVKLLMQTRISKASIDTLSGTVTLESAAGETFRAKKLVINYSTNFGVLLIDGVDRTGIFQAQKHRFVHLHLLVRDDKPGTFSYLRVFNNPMIHRVSDMTGQAKLEKGYHLICVGIFSSYVSGKQEELLIPEILHSLKEMNLLSASSQMISSCWNSYQSSTTDLHDLVKLEKETKGLVEVIYTADIMIGIRKNLAKFKTGNSH